MDIEFVEEVMLFLISNAQVFYNHVRPASVIVFCAYSFLVGILNDVNRVL